MRPTREEIEIGPAALARRLEAGDPVQVLDVRAPERLANGVVGPADDGRQERLPSPRESRHVGVCEDVGPVLVVAREGDGLADLVESGRPVEVAARQIALELPRLEGLAEELEGHGADPAGGC